MGKSLKKAGWVRIGIVLSVLWCGWSLWSYVTRHSDARAAMANLDRELCLYKKQTNQAIDCSDAWSKSFDQYPSLDLGDLLLSTLAPLLLAWLAAWIAVKTATWVWAGFKQG